MRQIEPINPFINTFPIEITRISESIPFKTEGATTGTVNRNVDIRKHTQVYKTTGVDIFQSLSYDGLKLLMYIIKHLGSDVDYIDLPRDKVSNMIHRSVSGVDKAKNELIDNNVIAKKEGRSLHWINPYYFYNGHLLKLKTASEEAGLNTMITINKSNKR